MSHKFGLRDHVPTETLIVRLEELSDAVTQGREAVSREFTMRVPAECDRDADLVLAAAAKRLREMHALLVRYRDETPLGHQPHMIAHLADAVLGR